MGLFGSKGEGTSESRSIDTIIGSEAIFEGVLITKNSVCIEGAFKGRLESKGRVILNPSGTLEADVVAEYVVVNGKAKGNIRALKQLDVGETGRIRGDVEVASVTVAKGGLLEGMCKMLPVAVECAPRPREASAQGGATSPDREGEAAGRHKAKGPVALVAGAARAADA